MTDYCSVTLWCDLAFRIYYASSQLILRVTGSCLNASVGQNLHSSWKKENSEARAKRLLNQVSLTIRKACKLKHTDTFGPPFHSLINLISKEMVHPLTNINLLTNHLEYISTLHPIDQTAVSGEFHMRYQATVFLNRFSPQSQAAPLHLFDVTTDGNQGYCTSKVKHQWILNR